MRAAVVAAVASLATLVSACSAAEQGGNADPDQVDTTALPKVGVCRDLTPADVALPANATAGVACTKPHTAETFLAVELPAALDDAEYDDPAVAKETYTTCAKGFAAFVGADESLVLRTTVTWASFRPSKKAWGKGARWVRCDALGGDATPTTYRRLPTTAKGLLAGRPDERWLSCARGETVGSGEKVPCSQKHDWRAVTTVKIGQPGDAYPGDRVMQSRTRAFCSQSVKAWLNYPAEYEYGFTFFHRAEWDVGNRRSVCWARSPE